MDDHLYNLDHVDLFNFQWMKPGFDSAAFEASAGEAEQCAYRLWCCYRDFCGNNLPLTEEQAASAVSGYLSFVAGHLRQMALGITPPSQADTENVAEEGGDNDNAMEDASNNANAVEEAAVEGRDDETIKGDCEAVDWGTYWGGRYAAQLFEDGRIDVKLFMSSDENRALVREACTNVCAISPLIPFLSSPPLCLSREFPSSSSVPLSLFMQVHEANQVAIYRTRCDKSRTCRPVISSSDCTKLL